jgi:hypothetical protein
MQMRAHAAHDGREDHIADPDAGGENVLRDVHDVPHHH